MTSKKQVLIFGSGSIAIKHTFNLLAEGLEVLIFSKRNIDKKSFFQKNLNVNFTNEINSINWSKVLFGIIANQTYLHEKYIRLLLKKKINVFCEKPVILNLKIASNLRKNILASKINFFVNYQLRRHSLVEKFKGLIKKEKIAYVIVEVSHDVRFWRKDKIRNKSYFINTRLGGGVILELIHEINLINYIFGRIVNISTIKNSINFLKCDDQALTIFKTNKKISGFLYQDMISKSKKRKIKIYTMDSKKIVLDFVKNEILISKNNKLSHVKIKSKLNNHGDLLKKNIQFYLKQLKKNKKSIRFFDESLYDLKICNKMHAKKK